MTALVEGAQSRPPAVLAAGVGTSKEVITIALPSQLVGADINVVPVDQIPDEEDGDDVSPESATNRIYMPVITTP